VPESVAEASDKLVWDAWIPPLRKTWSKEHEMKRVVALTYDPTRRVEPAMKGNRISVNGLEMYY
jgi:hypothetical protein